MFAYKRRTLFPVFRAILTLLKQRLWAFHCYLFKQHSSGYESHSGILYAQYAAICRSRPITT